MAVDLVFKRVIAAISGALFLVLAVVLAAGLGALGQYPLWARLVISLVIMGYGMFRVRSAWRSRDRVDQNFLD